jgi:hypothetical protein
VCLNQARDPRVVLVKDKYFSLRPKPLERWLWQQGVPQTAERVFWLHWEEGMKSGDWCSQLPIKRVASLCCIDPSTVTRAYQLLKTLGLIRRADPGRAEANPFQQATAITEVRVPRDLLVELSRAPDRAKPKSMTVAAPAVPEPLAPAPPSASLPTPKRPEVPSRQEAQAMWGRASAAEKARFFQASRSAATRIEFDADTRLSCEDRGQILTQLEQMARARSSPPPRRISVQPAVDTRSRKLSVLELARTRKRISEAVAGHEVAEVLRQVIWAVEEGALRRFELPLAVNIALKKIREGGWSRPHRMPPNWLPARLETCGAA